MTKLSQGASQSLMQKSADRADKFESPGHQSARVATNKDSTRTPNTNRVRFDEHKLKGSEKPGRGSQSSIAKKAGPSIYSSKGARSFKSKAESSNRHSK